MPAADRYRGAMPERARLAVYLLLAGLRPGQAVRLRADSIRREQHRVTAAVPQKNNTDSATVWTELPRPVVWALDDYLPVRTWRSPHSTATTGPLLLSRNGRAIDRVNTLIDIVRTVAATHPDLTELAPTLSPDAVAHTPSPFTPARNPTTRPLTPKPITGPEPGHRPAHRQQALLESFTASHRAVRTARPPEACLPPPGASPSRRQERKPITPKPGRPTACRIQPRHCMTASTTSGSSGGAWPDSSTARLVASNCSSACAM